MIADDLVADVVMPRLYCPLPVAVSPFRARLHEDSLRWARDVGIAPPGSPAAAYLARARLTDLAAFTMPFMTEDDLLLASRFCTWLFVHDDYYVDDERTVAAAGDEALRAVHAQVMAVLDARERGDVRVRDPLAVGVREICDQVAARADHVWRQRFARSIKEYLQANDWERRVRARRMAPDVSTYTKMRLFIGAVYPVFVFVNIANGVDSRAAFPQHPDVRVLSEMANNHICWVNDLLGFRKELPERNPSNLVLVLRQEHGLTLQAAVTRAAQMADKELRAFERLRDMLPSFGPVEDRQLRTYVTAMEHWMAGHLAWATEATRYRAARAAGAGR